MAAIYLHEHKDFPDLLRIIEEETNILAGLIEKDYWIMHCLYGLTKQGYNFQLKGGTSLSKGYGIIERFSEDIDLHINPPKELGINENPNNSNPGNIQKKKDYYDQLAKDISIPGIISVARDTAFDDEHKYNSGGIRLYYQQMVGPVEGVKQGILLEAGYDTVTPNSPVMIGSWAYDKAIKNPGIQIIDNRAVGIVCYDIGYTFVEKLQTIATKFRKEKNTGEASTNYMRQYYDVYSLLAVPQIVEFIGTEAYIKHKEKRFPAEDLNIPLKHNQAFLLEDENLRKAFQKRYEITKGLYYKGQPPFSALLQRIYEYIHLL